MLDLASNWDRFAQNTRNPTFKLSFLLIFVHRAKMNRKLIFKSPRFVPFGASFAQSEAESAIPAPLHRGLHVAHF